MNCERCQNLLLDHLYGLLDGAEAASADAHLATCPACAAARAETARVRGLFAQAAKNTFPNTKFEPPVPQKSTTRTPSPSTAPAVLPFPARPANPGRKVGGVTRRVAAFIPWAVAAAVLLAIPGTVVPVLSVFNRADATRRDADTAQRDADSAYRGSASARLERDGRLSDAQMKLATAEQTQTALLDRWVEEQKLAVQAAGARKLTIDIHKPATVQPGAPNDFLLVVHDERKVWESRGTKMVAEVRSSDAVLFTQDLDHEKRGNAHAIRLPASVWAKVKPDAELTLVVAEVDKRTNTRTALQEVRLAGPVFTTLLVTDKPAYRPGERLFFRSLTLDRATLKPPAREQVLRYELVAGPVATGRAVGGLSATGTTDLVRVGGDGNGRVEPVRTADGQPVRGVGCGEFVLPPDIADGEYTLVLRELQHPGGAVATLPLPVTRTVKVIAGAADHYAKLIGFTSASYVPGDTVEAWAELKFQDKPVQGADVVAVAVEADRVLVPLTEVAPKTDAAGRAKVRFVLPPDVLDGDVRLKVTFRAGVREEVVADRVPVVGRRLVVEFFPECGDTLVAGAPCKVYVRATTPAGQPVDISGVITDGERTLATVKTLRDDSERGANRGLASFTFKPEAGTRVWLKLDAPNTVYAPILKTAPVHQSAVALMGGPGAVASRTGFVLPEAKLDGVVMSVPDAITSPGQPIRVHLHSVGRTRHLVVGAYTRGRLSDTQKVTVEPGQLAEVRLMAGTDLINGGRGGVVRVTAFEEVDAKGAGPKPDLHPVAERLVFRRAGEVLKLSLDVSPADGATRLATGAYNAGAGVNCAITATDEKNNPAAAVLWAAVVNTGVAAGAKDRTMPTHFLLAGDVKNPDELEYADFLLTEHPRAGEALDLVLGTQGWRRFAEQAKAPAPGGKLPTPAVQNPELTRVMVQNGQHAVLAEPTAAREYRKITETYAPLYEAAVQAVARAKTAFDATLAATGDTRAIQQAESFAEVAAREAADKRDRAEAARAPVRQFRAAVWYGVAGFAALALLCGGVSLARPRTRLPLGASTLGSFGLAAFLFVAAGWGDEARAGAAESGFATRSTDPLRGLPETAPQPRDKPDATGGDRVAMNPQVVASKGGEMKNDGKPAGGFGGGPGDKVLPGVVAPVAPPRVGAAGKDVGMGYTFPHFLPNAARGADAKGKGGPEVNGPPLRVDPDRGSKLVALAPPPLAPGGFAPGPAPKYPNGGTGLAKVGPLHRNANDDRVDALKEANNKAAQYADERQRALADSMNAQLAGRAQAKAAGAESGFPHFAHDGALTPEKVEALALQQVRNTAAPVAPLVLREYASPRPTPAPIPDAADATDTILWQPVIVLPSDGKAVVGFHLGTAPGGYRVLVAGHTADGRLGEARTLIAVSPAPTVVPSTQPTPPAP